MVVIVFVATVSVMVASIYFLVAFVIGHQEEQAENRIQRLKAPNGCRILTFDDNVSESIDPVSMLDYCLINAIILHFFCVSFGLAKPQHNTKRIYPLLVTCHPVFVSNLTFAVGF